MVLKNTLHNKGFTLIEIIVVIAILAILLAITVPSFADYINNAKIAADNATLKILDTASSCYGVDKMKIKGDVFEGITTDEGRMQELVTNGELSKIVTPKQENAEFNWDVSSQKWVISGASSTPDELDGIAVESVTLDKTSMILAATTGGGMNDGPKTLVATVLPAEATNKAVTWTSSNTGIATVDSNGVVRFVSPGTAVITVMTVDGEKTATCTVRTQW